VHTSTNKIKFPVNVVAVRFTLHLPFILTFAYCNA
jgi:polyadenylation factor subunit 2